MRLTVWRIFAFSRRTRLNEALIMAYKYMHMSEIAHYGILVHTVATNTYFSPSLPGASGETRFEISSPRPTSYAYLMSIPRMRARIET